MEEGDAVTVFAYVADDDFITLVGMLRRNRVVLLMCPVYYCIGNVVGRISSDKDC